MPPPAGRRLGAILIAVTSAFGITTGRTTPSALAQTALSACVASPIEGHSGDPIFLSCSGLQPGQEQQIFMGCPTWYAPEAHRYGNFIYQMGPVTNTRGNFAGFKLQKFTLHGPSPTITCRIYIRVSDRAFGPDIPALYTVLPNDERLQKCDVSICAKVKVHLVQNGRAEDIDITNGWGGAIAEITISAPGVHQVERLHLDWNGAKHLRILLTGHPVKAGTGHVHVRFRLGGARGVSDAYVRIVRADALHSPPVHFSGGS